MNILFVNYGDFTTNSLNHIAGFANTLTGLGHSCVVAVAHDKETVTHIPDPLFIAATYEEALARPKLFPDQRPADLIHAWTPREGVRKFVLAYQRTLPSPARLVIHLEDNERFLLEAFTGRNFEELLADSAAQTATWLVDGLSHPARHAAFLRAADGATVIVDRLREFVPDDVATQVLPPGVDFASFQPQPPELAFRAEIGLLPHERSLVFTGSTTFANEAEIRELYLAVALLNQRGIPTRLVRTGFTQPEFTAGIPAEVLRHVLDLGFIKKAKLPKLLALADVLVQPGHPGPFNDYRLPSKLPEFLAMGKPVLLPPSNIASLMQDGHDAVFLRTGTPEEIATTCERLFSQPDLCAALGKNAAAFARRHFDLETNTRTLAGFYTATLARPSLVGWQFARHPGASEATLLADRLHRLAHSPGSSLDTAESEFDLLRQVLRYAEETADARAVAQAAAEQLTQQHIRNLETLLAEARHDVSTANETVRQREDSLAQAHQELIAARAARADELNREAARREQLREHAESLLARARARTSAAETLLAAKAAREGELNARIAELEQALAHQHTVVRQRDEKIRRMQDSVSWQLTSPLRAARRALIDSRHPAPPPSRWTFRYHFDQPSHWDAAPANGHISGWCVLADGSLVSGIRARIDDTWIEATYGIDRADVVRAENLSATSARCGFQLSYRLPLDTSRPITLEARTPDGNWQLLLAQQLSTTRSPRAVRDYTAWVAEFDTPTPEKARRLQSRLAALAPAQRPVISVLMPVYNAPEQWLTRAIESVRGQIYENWELCIADDASTAAHVRPLLEKFAASDARIRVVFRANNGHISAASNSALELVNGEYVALLDHDDELSPDALAEAALLLAREPHADVIFSDEDKIDETGRRYDPYFKPDYLPDLLLGQNCLSHLTVYRTELVRSAGGFRVGYEGSQDWDLALRVVERTTPDRVRHIPKVLYHWRAISGSTALAVDEKDYASDAARRALLDHFARREIAAELRAVAGHHWRVVYPLPKTRPLVSIIIPTRNGLDLVRTCVASIVTHTSYTPYEIVIVNNDSDDPDTLSYFRTVSREPNVRVIDYDAPFNYSAINNFAARHAQGEVLCFLNNDIEVITGQWLDEMVSHALRPEIGAVGAMLYYPNGTIQHAGVVLGLGGVANHAFLNHPHGSPGYMNRGRLAQNYSAVTAACLLIRRSVFQETSGFDETNLAIAFNDIDLCLRIRAAGYRNLWTPFAEFYHHESATRGTENTPEKQARFTREVDYMRRTWGALLDHDPAYNPNLSLDLLGWTLAWPPRGRHETVDGLEPASFAATVPAQS